MLEGAWYVAHKHFSVGNDVQVWLWQGAGVVWLFWLSCVGEQGSCPLVTVNVELLWESQLSSAWLAVGFSTASPVLTFMYQCPCALPLCTTSTSKSHCTDLYGHSLIQLYCFPHCTVPTGTSQIQLCNSFIHDIYLLLIGRSMNANLPWYQVYVSTYHLVRMYNRLHPNSKV